MDFCAKVTIVSQWRSEVQQKTRGRKLTAKAVLLIFAYITGL
jgi:hypothetical protein